MSSNSSDPAAGRTIPGVVINGQPAHARAGESILTVARSNGVSIPTLCHLEGLSDVGACRLCMVETVGSNKLIPACVTPVTPGMEIMTHSPTLAAYRKMVLELLFSERNHICAVCVANGHCELQAVAQACGMDHVTYAYACPSLPVDYSHPRFGLDHNRCILCTRCVRVCAEVEGASTWGLRDRGSSTLLIADLAGAVSPCGHTCPDQPCRSDPSVLADIPDKITYTGQQCQTYRKTTGKSHTPELKKVCFIKPLRHQGTPFYRINPLVFL